MEHWTLEQYKKHKEKNSKYKNKKLYVNGGEKFDSKREYERWMGLHYEQATGMIKDLRRQVRFELQPSYKKNGKTIRAITYVADFVYYDNIKGKIIVEDSKGYRTDVYKLKKKLFEYKYPDLEIKEV